MMIGRVTDGARPLPATMLADGWQSIGSENHDYIWWLHPPTHRTVCIDDYPWKNTKGIPAFHGEPADPATVGYVVSCRIHDELGNPYKGSCFWIESIGDAVKWARRIRAAILAETDSVVGHQLTFDDLLAGQSASLNAKEGIE